MYIVHRNNRPETDLFSNGFLERGDGPKGYIYMHLFICIYYIIIIGYVTSNLDRISYGIV